MHHPHPKLPAAGASEPRIHHLVGAATHRPWPAWTALAGHAPALERLVLLPRDADLGPGVPGPGDLVLVLGLPTGGAIHAVVTGPLARGLLGLLLDEGAGAPVPLSAAEAGLLAGLADAALQDLAPEPNPAPPGIQDVAVVRDDDRPTRALPDDWALGCDALVAAGPARGRLLLLLDDGAAAALRRAAESWTPPPAPGAAELPLAADLVVAFTRLAWSRLADLEPGDAVIFPTPAPPANDWPILLSVGGREFPACLRRTDAGREVEIRGVAMESAQPSEGTPPEGGDLLDRLPVTLTAILGRVELTAGAVARLAPGAVISLDRPVGAEVQLRAGRRAIGRGELVEVDGALGVRLTALTL